METVAHTLDYDAYKKRWGNPRYANRVIAIGRLLNSDGCSGVPEYYYLGCVEHDIAYRTGKDPFGNVLVKQEADRRFRWYMQAKSWFGRLSPMSWWRWFAVDKVGKHSWDASAPFPVYEDLPGEGDWEHDES